MMNAARFIVLAGFCMTLFAGCQSARPYATSPPQDEDGLERNFGYALLYGTIESEAQVDQVLMIKQPRSEVAEVLRQIGEFAREARDELCELAKRDETLGYDTHGLPFAEARTRDLITRSTTNSILLSSGRAFELNILMTQREALNYIVHLAQALRELDEDDDRAESLSGIEANASSLLNRVHELLQRLDDADDVNEEG